MYYSIAGLTNLDDALPEAQKVCEQVKKALKVDDVDSLFYASSIVSILKVKTKCEVSWGKADSVLKSLLSTDSNSAQLYRAVTALKNIGSVVDANVVLPLCDAVLKADDSPLSHAYVFYVASLLPTANIGKIQDLIEDVLAQADEVDEKFLQFDSGLFASAVVIDSAYQLSTAATAAAPLTDEKTLKFANYFLSRKHSQTVKEMFAVIAVLRTLTVNKYHVPVAVTLASQMSVSINNPHVQVRVCDLLGRGLGALTVTADTARHLGDDAVVLSKKPFTVSASDQTVYDLELLKVKPDSGFYRIVVSISTQQTDKKLIGLSAAEVEVKVIARVVVENAEVSVADREHTSAQKATKLEMPNKVQLEADYHQRLMMKFSLKDAATGKMLSAHQTFVRLTNTKTQQEVIFVAEDDGTGVHRFDLDVGGKSKDFNNLSGKYSMQLIVGDAVIENPITWHLADVQLTFGDDVVSTSDQYRYSKKPEIKHMFREPEKRPAAVVSNLFTVLAVLPVILLLVLWLMVGANLSNFTFSPATIGFHLGIAAIFALYGCYFLSLNMFSTLRYLALIGLPTFLFGNKLLSGIAARRK